MLNYLLYRLWTFLEFQSVIEFRKLSDAEILLLHIKSWVALGLSTFSSRFNSRKQFYVVIIHLNCWIVVPFHIPAVGTGSCLVLHRVLRRVPQCSVWSRSVYKSVSQLFEGLLSWSCDLQLTRAGDFPATAYSKSLGQVGLCPLSRSTWTWTSAQWWFA